MCCAYPTASISLDVDMTTRWESNRELSACRSLFGVRARQRLRSSIVGWFFAPRRRRAQARVNVNTELRSDDRPSKSWR